MPTPIPYRRELSFAYGRADSVAPLVRRVIARNPSAFTFHGTGTYIVGRGRVAVIDPGPDMPEHVNALRAALAGETVTHILITHTHRDHSPAAAEFKALTGAPTLGFGPHPTRPGGEEVEEGGDRLFVPDRRMNEGDVVAGPGWTIEAIHTPGHISNHLCFRLREAKALFSGDHVMGWSTTVVSPPDGNMAHYVASLNKLLARDDQVYYPTHGPPVPEPHGLVRAYIEHRREREEQILAGLRAGLTTIPALVARIYADVPRHLHGAAGRSVLAHLIDLEARGRVAAEGDEESAAYRLV
jgi:glyoxylase-like metal-dependent hydrolase (beta-lactamase superfamily II)